MKRCRHLLAGMELFGEGRKIRREISNAVLSLWGQWGLEAPRSGNDYKKRRPGWLLLETLRSASTIL